jgi:hypothetical protein
MTTTTTDPRVVIRSVSVAGLVAAVRDAAGVHDVTWSVGAWSCSCGVTQCGHVEVVAAATGKRWTPERRSSLVGDADHAFPIRFLAGQTEEVDRA